MLSFMADTKEKHGIHSGEFIIQPTFYPGTSDAFGSIIFWIMTLFCKRVAMFLLHQGSTSKGKAVFFRNNDPTYQINWCHNYKKYTRTSDRCSSSALDFYLGGTWFVYHPGPQQPDISHGILLSFQANALIWPQPLAFKSFPIHHSYFDLMLYILDNYIRLKTPPPPYKWKDANLVSTGYDIRSNPWGKYQDCTLHWCNALQSDRCVQILGRNLPPFLQGRRAKICCRSTLKIQAVCSSKTLVFEYQI
jgi:hypothetical protein